MDGVAVIIMILCISGVLFWLLSKVIRRIREKSRNVSVYTLLLKRTLNWHDTVGRYTFLLLMWITFTGWCLRPPVLIALAYGKVPPVLGTMLDEKNAWNDKLRMMRYDRECGDWLLSTSEGFYSLSSLNAVPVKEEKTPPVSVMGLNVWQKDSDKRWMAGSFSGMFVWDRINGKIFDFFTGYEVHEVSGPPFGKQAISGCISDMKSEPIIIDYEKGTASVPMPEEFSELPMSLWNLALEIHTGRIYTLLWKGTLIYIFFAGLAAMWCIYSGFIIRKTRS